MIARQQAVQPGALRSNFGNGLGDKAIGRCPCASEVVCRRASILLFFRKTYLDDLQLNSYEHGGISSCRGGRFLQRTSLFLAHSMTAGFNHIFAEPNNRSVTSRIKRGQKIAYPAQPRADEYPADVMTIIGEIQKSGVKSLWTIADALNAQGVRGARGGKWYATTVQKFLERNKSTA